MAPTTSLNVNVNVNLHAAVASDDQIIAVAAERVRTESTICTSNGAEAEFLPRPAARSDGANLLFYG